MTRAKRRLIMTGVAALAAAGFFVSAPLTASAGPTNETFTTYDACEARAAQIRDGSTGAWCEYEFHAWPLSFYRLYVSGA
ncbi:hypothetical protein [Kribbella sp. NPDC049227]|uniref:hypothetical protein n=1 Tax=Kribbella sp. NPDC049227 TaxID=3364113 RepID=UPI00371E5375